MEKFMNRQEADILKKIIEDNFINQRILAETTGHSLGVVNRSLRALIDEGYLTADCMPTADAKAAYDAARPRNAIILAAGFGMRMVPINLLSPKALIEVNGEPLIERIIGQLNDAGVTDITIVVGFMKEKFDYLIDRYDVELVVSPDYASKNNLSSLALVKDRISDTYIVPSNIWCAQSPFAGHEMYSWYMVGERTDRDSSVRVNRKNELVIAVNGEPGNKMTGVSYISRKDAPLLTAGLKRLNEDGRHDNDLWETALYSGGKMTVTARFAEPESIVEINTYEQLRELDSNSNHLKSEAIDLLARIFDATPGDITDIEVLKKGMTNRSFLFAVNNEKYIMRIPGEGTDELIDRNEEAEVFRAISGLGICDDPVYIDPKSGYKVTKFLEGVRTCDPRRPEDLKACMKKLKDFHDMKLSVDHSFDVFGQIDFYESLWKGQPSIYIDYEKTKEQVFSLRPYVESHVEDIVLTHIDAVPDNFLFYKSEDGNEKLQLTDWEYSGMQDPHLDIAMFAVYSHYDKAEIDRLIDIYFDGRCSNPTRIKIYCYISVCGLLWSNWCEYKRSLGIEFGEYSLRQYRYAKDYRKIAQRAIEEEEHSNG